MSPLIIHASLVFAAGCFGGLLNSIAVWIFGVTGVTSALGVAITPPLTPAWLYPRLVWGGIWGALFLLPLMRQHPLARGVMFSLGPTAIQLCLVFPIKAGKGIMGLDLGALTPLLVMVFNAVWGIGTAFWVKWSSGEGAPRSSLFHPADHLRACIDPATAKG